MNKFFKFLIVAMIVLDVVSIGLRIYVDREQDRQITHIKWRLDNLEALNLAEAQKSQQEPTCHH